MWGEQPWGRAAMFGVSAFIFSLAHAASASQDVLALLVPAFLMGLLLSYGMYRTGSLVPGIIAHALNNGLALTALLVCINNPTMCPNI
jgi:membrane protease YdiL (CAAX protease family)